MMIPVHVIGGFLGTGKTTTLRHLLGLVAGERLAVIVNDFGEGQIDPTVIEESGISVREIQGACICCTAPSQLNAALGRLLQEVRPDRIFIEPTGLARPADVVDTLRRGPHREQIALRPVIILVDPTRWQEGALREQGESADILVANRWDLASEVEKQVFLEWSRALWPGPIRVVSTSYGRLEADVLDGDAQERPHDHPHDHHHHASTEAFHSWTGRFPPEVLFSWEALEALPKVARLKGIFRTDRGTFLWQQVEGRVHVQPSHFRRDSRVDVIDRDPDLLAHVASAVNAAIKVALSDGLEVVGPESQRRTLRWEEIRRWEGVLDIGERIPGRQGSAVPLARVVEAVGAREIREAVVTAGDGFASPAVPWSALTDAWLVHSLGDGPLPAELGGPFRLLVAGNAGPAGPCSNVKNVTQLILR